MRYKELLEHGENWDRYWFNEKTNQLLHAFNVEHYTYVLQHLDSFNFKPKEKRAIQSKAKLVNNLVDKADVDIQSMYIFTDSSYVENMFDNGWFKGAIWNNKTAVIEGNSPRGARKLITKLLKINPNIIKADLELYDRVESFCRLSGDEFELFLKKAIL